MISRPIPIEASYDGCISSRVVPRLGPPPPPPLPPPPPPLPLAVTTQYNDPYPLGQEYSYPYWGVLAPSTVSSPPRSNAIYSAPPDRARPYRPYTDHLTRVPEAGPDLESVEPTTYRDTAIPRRPVGAPYRYGPSTRPMTARESLKPRPQTRDFSRGPISRREKRYGMADPAVWESVSRTLSQQQTLVRLVTPEQSPAVVEDLFSDAYVCPTRTSSQRRRLDRFTKDLKKYADATGARGKQPIASSTTSVSRNSLHTVDELLPFHREFQSAGLAVTSAEQQDKSPKRQERRGIVGSPRVPPLTDTTFDGQGGRTSPKKGLPWINKNCHLSRLSQVDEDEPSTMDFIDPDSPTKPLPPLPKDSTAKRDSRRKCLRQKDEIVVGY